MALPLFLLPIQITRALEAGLIREADEGKTWARREFIPPLITMPPSSRMSDATSTPWPLTFRPKR